MKRDKEKRPPRCGRECEWKDLRVGVVVRHENGTHYLIIHEDDDGRKFARMKIGNDPSWKKEVVQLTPAHVRCFRLPPPKASVDQARARVGDTPSRARPVPPVRLPEEDHYPEDGDSLG